MCLVGRGGLCVAVLGDRKCFVLIYCAGGVRRLCGCAIGSVYVLYLGN